MLLLPRRRYHNVTKYGGRRKILPIGATALAMSLYISSNIYRDERHVLLESNRLTRNFIADAVELTAPSVVNITTMSNRGYSTGSGFIVDSSGLVVTNAHVVRNSNRFKITLHDGRELVGVLHSKDKASDLALVKIVNDTGEKFPVARIGTSSTLRPGEWCIALGSPLTLQNTVTCGIISAIARQSSELGLPQLRSEFIQTDAAINRGNSGGPLVNLDGAVIGINTMKIAGAGISFAIPIDSAWQVIEQLRENGKVVRPYLGFTMINTMRHGSSSDERHVLIVQVTPGSPAERAGLRPGDVILSFDDRPVHTMSDVHDRLGYKIGRNIKMEVSNARSEGLANVKNDSNRRVTTIKTAERKIQT